MLARPDPLCIPERSLSMSHSAWLLSLVLAGVAVCGWAEEAKKETPTEAPKALVNTQTWAGQLGKSGQAMASLVVRPQEKGGKQLNLLLFVKRGDTANMKALGELLKMKPLPYASVTGVLAPDGKRVLITAITEAASPKKGKKNKK